MESSPRPAAPFWSAPSREVLAELGSTEAGLSTSEARLRLDRFGANRVRRRRRTGRWTLLGRQLGSPLVLLLVAAAAVSVAVGDRLESLIILAIVTASALIGFWQESSAQATVEALLQRVGVRVCAVRDGRELPVPSEELVPGDVVVLAAGSIVPADLRLLESAHLYVDQAALTGETFPVEKSPETAAPDAPLADRGSALFSGSHVVSGTATAVVVRTGQASELGGLAARPVRWGSPSRGCSLEPRSSPRPPPPSPSRQARPMSFWEPTAWTRKQ